LLQQQPVTAINLSDILNPQIQNSIVETILANILLSIIILGIIATIAFLLFRRFLSVISNKSKSFVENLVKYKEGWTALLFIVIGLIFALLGFAIFNDSNDSDNFANINSFAELTFTFGIAVSGAFYKVLEDKEKEADEKADNTEELKNFWYSERTDKKRFILLTYYQKYQNSTLHQDNQKLIRYINKNPVFKLAIIYMFNFYEEINEAFNNRSVNDEKLKRVYEEVFIDDYKRFKPWLDDCGSRGFEETIKRIRELCAKFGYNADSIEKICQT
jgi:hypothetical protein